MSASFELRKEMQHAKEKLEARIFSDDEIKKLRETGVKSFAASFKKSIEEQKELGIDNILGVGIGTKYRSGVRTNEICLKIFVRKKLPKSNVESSYIVEKTEGGFLTDVM